MQDLERGTGVSQSQVVSFGNTSIINIPKLRDRPRVLTFGDKEQEVSDFTKLKALETQSEEVVFAATQS